MEPFIDTVVVCSITALVIVITGNYGEELTQVEGITLTSQAFASVISWFPFVLFVAVTLFAFSTMISWSYYGQQAWASLFGSSKIADLSFKLTLPDKTANKEPKLFSESYLSIAFGS